MYRNLELSIQHVEHELSHSKKNNRLLNKIEQQQQQIDDGINQFDWSDLPPY